MRGPDEGAGGTAVGAPHRRADRPAGVLAAATAGVLTVAAALLVAVRGDVSRLVRAAPPLTDPARTLPSLTVVPQSWQFDGQFYYRLAIAPFSSAATVAGVTFDYPSLRASRLGLGVLGYLASAGQAAWVPWALFVVNAIGLVVLAVVGAGLAAGAGAHRLWGLLLPAWPGLAYSLAFDLGEIVASVFLCGAILAALRHRAGWASVLLAAAVCSRETATLGVAAFLVTWCVQRVGHRDPAGRAVLLRAGLVATAAFAVLQVTGYLRFRTVPVLETLRINSGGDSTGVWQALADAWPVRDRADVLQLAGLAVLAGLFVLGLVALVRRTRTPLVLRVGWLLATAALIAQNGNPWAEPKSFLRASTEFGLFSLVAAIHGGTRMRIAAAVVVVPGWLGTVLFVVFSEAAAVPALR